MTVMTSSIEISLHGKRVETAAQALQDFLLGQGYQLQGAFACAINNTFVPRPQWPARALQAGDRIDVITPIEGG
jgi:sulfur carrier protein